MTPKTVLCVDDEAHVLSALKRLLRREGYALLTAGGAVEGLRVLETQEVHLVISDHRMPGMSGTQFLREVRRRWPGVVRILMTGYADMGALVEAVNECEIFRFLPKPWDETQLKAAIREGLGRQCGTSAPACGVCRRVTPEGGDARLTGCAEGKPTEAGPSPDPVSPASGL